MESNIFTISLAKNPNITVDIIPGHYTTSNMHTNNYLDVSSLRSDAIVARDVAREIVLPYSSTPIDTIVCMEKMEVIGAYVAQELFQEDSSGINSGNRIKVLSPLNNAYGNLVFSGRVIKWITNKNILLLMGTISSGSTLKKIIECISYYGGTISGISALYSASPITSSTEIHTLFSSADIPGYKIFTASECEFCKEGIKLDAIVSSEGYTKID